MAARTRSAAWQRYSALREPCPGCELAGYQTRDRKPAHETCGRSVRPGGTLLACHSLREGAPPAWEPKGSGTLETWLWWIPDGSARPRAPQPRRREVVLPVAGAAPDDVLDLALRAVRSRLSAVTLASAGAAAAFFDASGAQWNADAYSVLPQQWEEAQALGIDLGAAGAYSIPGLIVRGGLVIGFVRARIDPKQAMVEWVLGPAGELRGFAVRFLGPVRDGAAKTKSYGRLRLHYAYGYHCNPSQSIVATEGRRKANEAGRRLGCRALGFPGVAVGPGLLDEARLAIAAARPRRLILAPDWADLVDGDPRHDGVRSAVLRAWAWLARRARALGAEVLWAAWDPAAGKGIDDLLAAGGEPELLEWPAYLERWAWAKRPPELLRAPADPFPWIAGPPVRDIAEASKRAEQLIGRWKVGERSLALSSFPGTGKTTAFARDLLRRLDAGELSCAILALPTNAIVREKAAIVRRIAAEQRSAVSIVEGLGAQPTREYGYYCERHALRGYLASRGRWGCEGCDLIVACKGEPGRFLCDDEDLRRQMLGAGPPAPVLVLTSTAKLPFLLQSLPPDCACVVDDVTLPTFGLISPARRALAELGVAAANVEALLEGQSLSRAAAALEAHPDQQLPELLVAQVVGDVLRAAADFEDPHTEIALAVERAHPVVAEQIRDGTLRAPRNPRLRRSIWSWDIREEVDGADGRPAATRWALSIARAQLNGLPPHIVKTTWSATAWIPDVDMIRLARAGRLAWASVGPMPAQLAAAVSADVEHVYAAPSALATIAVSDRLWGRHEGRLVAAVVEAMQRRAAAWPIAYRGQTYATAGAVVRLADARQLADRARIATYGAGHAATDAMADVDVLAVSRHAVPPAEVTRVATVLRRAFVLPAPESAPGESRRAWRGWGGHRPTRQVWVRADPLEQAVDEFWACQIQANAVGRCRPLSAPGPRLAVLLAGMPWRGLAVDDVATLAELAVDLGLELELPVEPSAEEVAEQAARREAQEAQEAETVALAFQAYVEKHRFPPSQRELAKASGVSRRVVRRSEKTLLARAESAVLAKVVRKVEVYNPTLTLWHSDCSGEGESTERGRVGQDYKSCTCKTCRLLQATSREQLASILRQRIDGLAERTIRRHISTLLAGSVLPAESAARPGLLAVARALAEWLGQQVPLPSLFAADSWIG